LRFFCTAVRPLVFFNRLANAARDILHHSDNSSSVQESNGTKTSETNNCDKSLANAYDIALTEVNGDTLKSASLPWRRLHKDD
jgi:uncharacterized membrane protein YkoI